MAGRNAAAGGESGDLGGVGVRERLARLGVELAERRAPDRMVRAGMRAAVGRRLAAEQQRSPGERRQWIEDWSAGPIALVPDEANRQHYEVPPEFFELILGPRLKYSSCLWEVGDDNDSLARAEERMLDLTIDQAGLSDGMTVLELGSGWGSLTLRMAERFPTSRILAVSNSKPQGEFIRARAAAMGLHNVEHRVVDVNDLLEAGLARSGFDRIVSVEMLEHVRNHRRLFGDAASLLAADGAMYVHVFAHRTLFWPFEDDGAANWMARYFFTGGVMPSHGLFGDLLCGADGVPGGMGASPGDGAGPLVVANRWWFNGTHYARTLDAWLERLDRNRRKVVGVLQPVYGPDTDRWVQRWRMFLMACSELFGYADGTEWGVSHQLLRRP